MRKGKDEKERGYREGLQVSEMMKKLPNEEILKMLIYFQLVEKSER